MASERNDFGGTQLWQLAQGFADAICDLADSLPRTRSADVIARQLIRSAMSVAANIAEGHGRFSLAAYRNPLGIARGSATESRGWIDLLARRKLALPGKTDALDQRRKRLIALLTLRINDLEKRLATRQVRDVGDGYDPGIGDVSLFESSNVPNDDEGEVGL